MTTRQTSNPKGGRSQLAFMKLIQSNKNLNPHHGPVTRAELAQHTHPYDCWISLDGLVFNVTPYLEYHPGGADEILSHAGTDATEVYMRIHPWVNYRAILEPLLVGKLVDYVPSLKSSEPVKQPTVQYVTQVTEAFRPHRVEQPAASAAGERVSWLSRILGIFRN